MKISDVSCESDIFERKKKNDIKGNSTVTLHQDTVGSVRISRGFHMERESGGLNL